MRDFRILAVTIAVVLLDQLTKFWVKSALNLYQSVRVIGEDFFRLTYIQNDGIAFGLEFGGRTFLIIFTSLALILLSYYLYTLRNSPLAPRFALAMILGGALGNFIDRVFIGQVTDFFDFDFPDFIMTRWPVFNIADSAVSVGMTILVVYLVFFCKEEQLKTNSSPAAEN